MKLFEYEAKDLFRKNGIPTPRGAPAGSITQARKAARRLGPPLVIKAQLLVAGRGKIGGILFADTLKAADEANDKLFEKRIQNMPVTRVLVEERIQIKTELYFGITIDRIKRAYVLVASSKGGADIEETAVGSSNGIYRTFVSQRQGFRWSDAKHIACRMGYSGAQKTELSAILRKIYQLAMDLDAELVEVNPLAETLDGRFVAVDARLIIDDNALFRHPELEKLQFEENRERTADEIRALKSGLAYVKLEGRVGVLGNGAGLVMATLDTIHHYGEKAADFLDLGGGATTDRIKTAIEIVISDPDVSAVLVNILGGLTKCDEVARAIVETRQEFGDAKPIIARLVGTNEEEGRRILAQAGVQVMESMEEAVNHVVEEIRNRTDPGWA